MISVSLSDAIESELRDVGVRGKARSNYHERIYLARRLSVMKFIRGYDPGDKNILIKLGNLSDWANTKPVKETMSEAGGIRSENQNEACMLATSRSRPRIYYPLNFTFLPPNMCNTSESTII